MRKPTKTISGVAPLAVMLPPRKCDHGVCLYCPSLNAPQSYTPESPAVLRAKECEYDPIKQVKVRLKAFRAMGHPTDKIELIIMGGTFLSYPEEFQFDFVKKCYDALNNRVGSAPTNNQNKSMRVGSAPTNNQNRCVRVSKNLNEAKKINETAGHRCVALCVETRPDVCTDHHVRNMLEWGVTRVELGVQAIDDEIYKKVNRGHTVRDVIDATTRLKKAGFKIGYHLMPGIPGSNPKKDIQMFKKIFSSKDFKPDQIKIYPCQVLKGAGIENLYYGGEYVPYTKRQVTEIIIRMLKLTPRYCRIMRVMREIPPSYLVAGIKNIDIRKDIEEKIREEKYSFFSNLPFLKRKNSVDEIRFREIGFAIRDKRKINSKIKIKITKYKASGGAEFFVEAVNKDNILFGLLRLRLDKGMPAMVRELHVYGPTLKLKEKAGSEWQHKGLGKLLMQTAEKIAKKKGWKNIRVISGVGVREYYRKLGYRLDGDGVYVEKGL